MAAPVTYTTTIAATKTIGEIQQVLANVGAARIAVDYQEGLPIHLPMGVTKDGQGPADGTPALHHYECWCPDLSCPLTRALKTGWRAGAREMTKRRSSKTKIYAPPREHPDSGKPVF